MSDQQSEIEWRDDKIPVSTRFDDPYFSLDDGLAESRHVFLAGNDLPNRFRDGFHIAELGFGTGLNLLTALQSFIDSNAAGQLRFTSFEAFPMTRQDAESALQAFPSLAHLVEPLLDAWQQTSFVVDTPQLQAEIVVGDARQMVKAMKRPVDAWFLDGFSPSKNPELWEHDLLLEVGKETAANGTFATYTAAGHVRRALEDAGFDVQRMPGFGRKRHMSVGKLR